MPLESGQASQRHFDDRLRLDIGQSEGLHQLLLGVGDRLGGADDGDHLVDVVDGDLLSLADVGLVFRFGEIEAHAALDDLLLVLHVAGEHILEAQHLRLAVDQRQHIDGEGVLQLGVLVKLIEYDLRVGVAFALDDYADALFAVRFVADVTHALDAAVANAAGDLLYEVGFVDGVGDLGNGDAPLVLVDLGGGADGDVPASGGVGADDAAHAVDGGGGREIGPLDVLHQLGDGDVGIVHVAHAGGGDLAQVVRRDVGRHTDGDTDRAVDQKVGYAAGQDGRLLELVVEVGHKVDDLFFDVGEHCVGEAAHARLGVTVGGGAVTVDIAEVAVPLYQRVAQREGLRQAHHRVVDGDVAVRMIAAQHVTDRGRRFAEGAVVREVILVHGVKYAAVDRL